MEYATATARLASFPAPTKRSKAGWPHKNPNPEALAKAGFYYKPQGAGSDNVVCYLCERSLDGWEADDDPVQEHLRHSPECGWAVMMSHAQAEKHDTEEMVDPTSAAIADARRATFSIGWPHESKRGWTCKTEKMVEAGWHFAPTEECEDWVSCAYCKLSLDGWEPKDNPFDEHYRRNQDCPFFVFAGTTAPSKRPKAKKGRASKSARTSKASTRTSTRLSTQSDITMQSDMEAPSMTDIPDLDESIDTSGISVKSNMSVASTATNKGKRKAAGGKKTAKSKKAKTARSTRTKKAQAEPGPESEEVVVIPAPEPEPEPVQEIEEPQPMPEASPREKKDLIAATAHSPTPKKQAQEVTYPKIAKASKKRASQSSQQHTSPPQKQPTPQRPPTPRAASPTPQPSPSNSDIENAPPSSLPPSARPPPLSAASQSSPSSASPWTPVDLEVVFQSTPLGLQGIFDSDQQLGDSEKQMTVQEWIEYVAVKAEEDLRTEGERVVGVFEKEGGRALGVLEGVECI